MRKVPIEVEQDILSKYYTHTASELEKEYYDNATIYMDRKYNLAQQFFEYMEISPKTWTVNKK